jgi:hypothetical protein
MTKLLIGGKEMDLEVGKEATISYGCDSHPAKISAMSETKAFITMELTEYQYRATEKGKATGMGHQDWIIDWDQPLNGVVRAKVNKKTGKFVGPKSFAGISVGHARVYYCWEL